MDKQTKMPQEVSENLEQLIVLLKQFQGTASPEDWYYIPEAVDDLYDSLQSYLIGAQ